MMYYNEYGQLHRDDGPAVEYPDGRKEWWLHGKQVDELTVWLSSGSKECV